MARHIALALLIYLAPWGAHAAEGWRQAIIGIEDRWVEIRYVMTDTKARLAASRALEDDSRALLEATPQRAEVKFWHGMVLLLEPEYKRDLGALRQVREAKRLFEDVEAENPRLFDGRVNTALGMLYSGVPGWPIAFGDDKKAAAYFLKALEIDPAGQETNYLYGDFLRGKKKPAEAVPYFEAAVRAPLRPGHERADQFRHKEAEEDLAAARKEIRP
jgi:tetratricopeptide (TPR) repeat protein